MAILNSLPTLSSAIVALAAVYALWDYGRRRLDSNKTRQDALMRKIDRLATLESTLAEGHEYMRAILATFINSATDIITISEEEKKHLRNRLSRDKFNK